jgi:hypothetical protein
VPESAAAGDAAGQDASLPDAVAAAAPGALPGALFAAVTGAVLAAARSAGLIAARGAAAAGAVSPVTASATVAVAAVRAGTLRERLKSWVGHVFIRRTHYSTFSDICLHNE